jgi:hypothetical protein
MGSMLGAKSCVRVDEVAATTIDAALTGGGRKEHTSSDNVSMVAKGKEVLETMKKSTDLKQ